MDVYPGTSSQEDVTGSVASNVIVSTDGGGGESSWLPALPHVLTAAMANFMFGYHIGCVLSFPAFISGFCCLICFCLKKISKLRL